VFPGLPRAHPPPLPAQGPQPPIPFLPVPEMPLAHLLARYGRARALGAEALGRMAQLIGPRRTGVEPPIARTPFPLALDGAATARMVASPLAACRLRQRPVTSPTEDGPPQPAGPFALPVPVPLAESRRTFGQGSRAQGAQPHGPMPGLVPPPRVAEAIPRGTADALLPHRPSIRLRT
jgi:hypothetical protein